MIWVLIITVVLTISHFASDHIGKRLDLAKHAAHSFGGGMAIAYVFLHLLPELEQGHKIFGHSIHLLALGGFVLFYVMETLGGKPPKRRTRLSTQNRIT